MNHPIDYDPEISRRVNPELCRRADTKHSKLLDILIDKSIKRLEDKSYKPRIRDALKAIQLRQEVVKTSEAERSETHRAERSETHRAERSETHRAEKIFWDEIEAIRQEELPKLYAEEAVSLETQIQNTIIGLKDQVKNGILPVKIITDTFNQGKSKESRLSYRRIGQLLSNMGFRKAKTQTVTYAILWDDDLLSKNTSPDVEKNEKHLSANPASPAYPASSADRSKAPGS